MSRTKKTVKKADGKANGKATNGKAHNKSEKVVQLMLKKDGATIHDFVKAGFNQPAMAAVKAAKRRKFKTKIVHKAGELTRYQASR